MFFPDFATRESLKCCLRNIGSETQRDEYLSIYPYGLKKQRKENRNLISRPPCVAGGVVSASKVLAEELRSRYEPSVSLMSTVTSTRKNC